MENKDREEGEGKEDTNEVSLKLEQIKQHGAKWHSFLLK